jgi:large subunit ribosomal protein L15
VLVERGVIRRSLDGVKVLGDGELKKKLTVKAQAFSASAREKITKAGGSCEQLPMPGIRHTPKPVATEEKK